MDWKERKRRGGLAAKAVKPTIKSTPRAQPRITNYGSLARCDCELCCGGLEEGQFQATCRGHGGQALKTFKQQKEKIPKGSLHEAFAQAFQALLQLLAQKPLSLL